MQPMNFVRTIAACVFALVFVCQPALASALSPASPESRVGAFEDVQAAFTGGLGAASGEQHKGIGVAYDEFASGYRFAARGMTRPKGVPADWVAKPSKTGGGTRFVDPANPHNSVRVMPGDPKSPFPNSQKPYVRHLKDGQSLDVNGNVVPKNTPEAHIPLEDFVWPF
jgi:hypothetical protein